MNRNIALTCLILVALSTNGFAQDVEKDVMSSIDLFFEGFAEGDTTKMWTVTDRGARLVITTFDEDNSPVMRPITMDQFMAFIASPREEEIIETYWNPDIFVHDNLATVWLDYNLWVGERIDHCGKDAFQLARDSVNWKIIAIADTQRFTGCEPYK